MAIFRKRRKKIDESQVHYQNLLVMFNYDLRRVGKEGSVVIMSYDGKELSYIIEGKDKKIIKTVEDITKDMYLRFIKELMAYKLCQRFEVRFQL